MPHLRHTDIDIGTFGNATLAELLLREIVATTVKTPTRNTYHFRPSRQPNSFCASPA
jgi:hypothetical protein